MAASLAFVYFGPHPKTETEARFIALQDLHAWINQASAATMPDEISRKKPPWGKLTQRIPTVSPLESIYFTFFR